MPTTQQRRVSRVFKRFKNLVLPRSFSNNSLSKANASDSDSEYMDTPSPPIRRERNIEGRRRARTLTHDSETPAKLEKRLSSFFDNYYSDHPLSRSQTERYFDQVELSPAPRYHNSPKL